MDNQQLSLKYFKFKTNHHFGAVMAIDIFDAILLVAERFSEDSLDNIVEISKEDMIKMTSMKKNPFLPETEK